jgi:hypothetical protein
MVGGMEGVTEIGDEYFGLDDWAWRGGGMEEVVGWRERKELAWEEEEYWEEFEGERMG